MQLSEMCHAKHSQGGPIGEAPEGNMGECREDVAPAVGVVEDPAVRVRAMV